MMRRIAAITVTALLSGIALTAGAATAQASTWGSPHRAGHEVFASLRLWRVDLRTKAVHTAWLSCFAHRTGDALRVQGIGEVKDATAACRELVAVNGDFRALDVHPTWMTPDISASVYAGERGWWNGRKVDHYAVYRNRPELTKSTGAVFDF